MNSHRTGWFWARMVFLALAFLLGMGGAMIGEARPEYSSTWAMILISSATIIMVFPFSVVSLKFIECVMGITLQRIDWNRPLWDIRHYSNFFSFAAIFLACNGAGGAIFSLATAKYLLAIQHSWIVAGGIFAVLGALFTTRGKQTQKVQNDSSVFVSSPNSRRPRNMRIGSYILLVTSLSMIAVAITWAWFTHSFLHSAVHVDGVLTRFETSRGDEGSTLYHPVVRYTDSDNNIHEHRSGVGRSHPSYKTGDVVPIAYDPNDPSKAKINSPLYLWGGSAICGGLGIVALIVSYICLRVTRVAPENPIPSIERR